MSATDPIKITCPECKKVIAVPPDLLGKKVRCKGCSKVFEAQKPAPPKETAKPAEEDKKNSKPGMIQMMMAKPTACTIRYYKLGALIAPRNYQVKMQSYVFFVVTTI